jgi:hypothetical protein
MIYFVLTPEGYEELVSKVGQVPSPLWVNDGILSESEITKLRKTGAEITNFMSRIAPHDMSGIANALSTIQQHHPKQRIWVEYAPDL